MDWHWIILLTDLVNMKVFPLKWRAMVNICRHLNVKLSQMSWVFTIWCNKVRNKLWLA